ncbi:MAG: glycosyltransferase, partial [Candidatus Omnitrophica bacterium]|nr:glycosyltransferase [Candidatus Omnitrophota bacterium]
MSQFLVDAYLALLGVLACYGVYRYHLLWLYYRVKDTRLVSPAIATWPTVTIQIPVYNERYVIERAIHAACAVDYPREQLEIQLLDDSVDETSEIISRTLAPYRQAGLNVQHLKRPTREHFKAGALAEGLKSAV